ncbi:hypothetical protein NLI96_g13242 [Meripilus lineatus]|uniref:Tyrosine-protein phosphatase domain-containing protein n=1 Tax=Meripilus lineatus TaxID=2056292 RepID=A0AAD5UT32_9APHY|nr:hypothetical protein NLI96_g13242 [Physisporinus lineatus]
MSARRFNPLSPSKRKRQRPTQSRPSGLFLLSEAPRTRLPPATRTLGLPRHPDHLTIATRTYTQLVNPPSASRPDRPDDPQDPFLSEDNATNNEFNDTLYHFVGDDDVNRNHQKRQRQWYNWQHETIPSLVQPFLSIFRETSSLREPPAPAPPYDCSCGSGRSLKVICVYFERMSHPLLVALIMLLIAL